MSRFIRTPLAIIFVTLTLVFCVGVISFALYLLHPTATTVTDSLESGQASSSRPFPVSVNQKAKLIVENATLDDYVSTELSINPENLRQNRLRDRLFAKLLEFDFYQQLASPITRILVIYPGQRQEEIAASFARILGWSAAEKAEFVELISEELPVLSEGKFYPGRYIVPRQAPPAVVAELIYSEFYGEVLARYDDSVARQVSLADALIIASLLQREAYDFTDMRIISGIIWNRLFIDMPLQLDASLQYIRGGSPYEASWWPKVVPDDKFLDSPFNTYQEVGLPPAPIANPSVEAIVAALNPRITDCLFYFHEDDGTFHCSVTYEEHVEKLKSLYGTGR